MPEATIRRSTKPPPASHDWSFERVGLGYRCWNEEVATEYRITRLHRRNESLTGELAIRTRIAGVRTFQNGIDHEFGGLMHLARINVLSSSARSALARILERRQDGQPAETRLDWEHGLERLCQGVIEQEQKGEVTVALGELPRATGRDQWAVEPLILRERAALIYGPGGVGKSLLALTCALSVAAHREIMPGIAPAISGPVLYLDWETTPQVVNDRIRAVCEGHGFAPPANQFLYRRCVHPLADDAEDLARIIDERGIVMVVVDSAAYAMGPSGEYGDMNESTLRMHEALRLLKTTNLIVDHVNKAEMHARPGKATPYGSAYKINAVRTSWEIRQVPAPDGVLRINLYHAKSNDTRLLPPIGLELDWAEGSITFAPSNMVTEAEDVAETSHLSKQQRIVSYIAELGGTTRAAIYGAFPYMEASEIRTYLSRAVKQNQILIDGERFLPVSKERFTTLRGGRQDD